MKTLHPDFIDHFAAIAGNYDVVLSDVWGVVHNGLRPRPEPATRSPVSASKAASLFSLQMRRDRATLWRVSL
jgi:hypothetical protein